eukprot:TRINITY_DN4323_c0_g1_i5.p1 TRINITY_DN4323_c0_g1~~TRINITY_DN4323_c0_g1_i5.p1  ORF type:complete len:275 (+),score=67.15 TRINITY_DN4323_c0_g1_i5:229-1053(+)
MLCLLPVNRDTAIEIIEQLILNQQFSLKDYEDYNPSLLKQLIKRQKNVSNFTLKFQQMIKEFCNDQENLYEFTWEEIDNKINLRVIKVNDQLQLYETTITLNDCKNDKNKNDFLVFEQYADPANNEQTIKLRKKLLEICTYKITNASQDKLTVEIEFKEKNDNQVQLLEINELKFVLTLKEQIVKKLHYQLQEQDMAKYIKFLEILQDLTEKQNKQIKEQEEEEKNNDLKEQDLEIYTQSIEKKFIEEYNQKVQELKIQVEKWKNKDNKEENKN